MLMTFNIPVNADLGKHLPVMLCAVRPNTRTYLRFWLQIWRIILHSAFHISNLDPSLIPHLTVLMRAALNMLSYLSCLWRHFCQLSPQAYLQWACVEQ